jgi:ferric-dicitrate binding protein FerR (iron transport regulator)
MLNKLNILKKFFAKIQNDEELKQLFYWLNSAKGQSEIEEELDSRWAKVKTEENVVVNSEKIFNNVKEQIGKEGIVRLNNTIKKFIPYAAILIIALAASFYFSYIKSSSNNVYNNTYTSFVTENGQRSKVVLPDRSIVWLNSGTTLSYLYSKNEKRSIVLNGEAYFNVRKDKDNPFTVKANGIDVKVLGTKFGVESYPGVGKTFVVLESGSVELKYGNNENNVTKLVPGELATFDSANKSLEIAEVKPEKYVSWKDNKLVFRNEPMKNVVLDLARWFNIEIEILDEEVYNSIFTATITSENYQQIFNLIEYSCSVKCEISENHKTGKLPRITIVKN